MFYVQPSDHFLLGDIPYEHFDVGLEKPQPRAGNAIRIKGAKNGCWIVHHERWHTAVGLKWGENTCEY